MRALQLTDMHRERPDLATSFAMAASGRGIAARGWREQIAR